MNRQIGKRLTTALRIFLGLLFIVVGVGKIFVVQPFSQTISSITLLSPDTAKFLASIVIAVEIVGGILLLLHFKTRIVAITLCCLIGVFIWVLYTAIAQNRETICYCFGILNIELPNHIELTIDLILFNFLALLAILERPPSVSVPATAWQKFFTVALAGMVMFLQVGMVLPAYKRANESAKADIHRAVIYATERSKEFASGSEGNRLLFLLNFHDFDCHVCLDDFISLCDSINVTFQHRDRVVILFRQIDLDSVRLTRWALARGIPFPVLAIQESLLSRHGIAKSMAAVVDQSGEVIFFGELPLAAKQRDDLLRHLTSSD